ncbi:site-specific integrase [Clostridium sp. HBUAS56017]|uniref:tyrosine-type recombinase/integrase n=1 Tax=Clostridium sp. HBUAS56017 TaxID=2571128 RepID=UPI001177DA00|nr:site-specific integrase [Clostridium sp. HBUAS56017]
MDFNIIYRKKDKGIQAIVSYKDNSGKWKQKSKQGFTNDKKGEKLAANWANDTITDLKKNGLLNKEYEHITFAELFDMIVSDKKHTMQYNTIRNYENAHGHFNTLDNMLVRDIKNIDIQRCVNEMSTSLKSSTIKNYVTIIKTIFNLAVKDYEIISNSPIRKITYKKDKIKEKRALTSTEVETLLSKLKGKNVYIPTLLAVKCGLRLGEISGLTWDNIDIKNRTITIEKQYKNVENKYVLGTLKGTNSYRTIPVSKKVLDEILDSKPKTINMNNRIITYKTTDSLSRATKWAYPKAGFKISIHELRHTFATLLIANGLDFKTAAEILGHDVEQTIKTYSHVTDEMRIKARNIINIL